MWQENDTIVFWPEGEREHFVTDPSRLDPKGLSNARKMLTVLSISGSVVRASIATRSSQILTFLAPQIGATSVGDAQAVRIAGEREAPLAIVATFGGSRDGMGLKFAAKAIADEAGIELREIESVLKDATKTRTIAIATFGPKADVAVDEAYGLALYLGAVMNDYRAESSNLAT